jgi:dihydropyrimidinase
MSTNPAKLFDLYPNKGSLQLGTDADIVIFDPFLEKRINPSDLHYTIDWNPFTDFKVRGWPTTTILKGKILCANGEFIGPSNHGRFIKRPPHQYSK